MNGENTSIIEEQLNPRRAQNNSGKIRDGDLSNSIEGNKICMLSLTLTTSKEERMHG